MREYYDSNEEEEFSRRASRSRSRRNHEDEQEPRRRGRGPAILGDEADRRDLDDVLEDDQRLGHDHCPCHPPFLPAQGALGGHPPHG